MGDLLKEFFNKEILRCGEKKDDDDDDDDGLLTAEEVDVQTKNFEGMYENVDTTPVIGDDDDAVDITREVSSPSTPIARGTDVPFIGKTFVSLMEAENFYKSYAKQNGFEVRIKTRRKSTKTNDWCSCMFECKRAGKEISPCPKFDDVDVDSPIWFTPDKKGKNISKGLRKRDPLEGHGCKARMFVSHKIKSNVWVITSFEESHTHPMVSPKKANYLSSNRNVTSVIRELINVCRKANIGGSKIHQIIQLQAGGLETAPVSLKDVENVIRDFRREEFDPNDAQAAIDYMNKLQEESGGKFFFRIQFDDDNRIKCLVWVDGRSRLAYKNFGDVVAFDTTYRTNRYRMPFAPFTGVNHHFHSILFGFALLCNEKEETFDWVFNTWLEAMEGKAPTTIITDQDPSMAGAISRVFPGTHHYLCTWHISQKYPTKFGPIYQAYPQFKTEYDQCVNKSLTIQEFEDRWRHMLVTYSLESHSWLNDLYVVREQWIPAYTRRFFAAGMSSTQRSEGMNSFFDQFVSSCTGMKDFVQKSVEALDKQFFKERKEDFDTKYYSRQLNFRTPLELHGAQLYTKNIFKRFQTELVKSVCFTCEKLKDCCTKEVKTFSLHNRVKGTKDHRVYTVVHWIDYDLYKCSCQMFEYSAMICRHLLRYLDLINVNEIPSSLISERWMRDANKNHGELPIGDATAGGADFESSQGMRYNHLSQLFAKLALEASMTMKGYKHAIELVERESITFSSIPPDDWSNPVGDEKEVLPDHLTAEDSRNQTIHEKVYEPNVVQTKGRKREKRIKSSLEKAMKVKRLRKCKICNCLTDHDSQNHHKVKKD